MLEPACAAILQRIAVNDDYKLRVPQTMFFWDEAVNPTH